VIRRRLSQTRIVLILGCLLWSIGVGAGLSVLWHFEMTPGKGGEAPAMWPTQSQLTRHPQLPTLVMLVHPRCSCSRASLQELARLLTRLPGRLSAAVLFYIPEAGGVAWEKTDLWHTAAALPGVQAVWDINGTEARLFQASTSGYTVLYDASGRLLFQGGITPLRGHSGDNAGSNAIATLLVQQRPDRDHTFAFGCDLFAPDLHLEQRYDDRTP